MTKEQAKLIERKLDCMTGKNRGNTTIQDVCEMIDGLGLDVSVTAKQIAKMIKSSNSKYGY